MKSTVSLNSSIEKPPETYISQLLGDYHLEHKPHEQLILNIRVEAGTTVTLIDDLHTHLFLNSSIEFIVEKDAQLSYEIKILDGIENSFIGNKQTVTIPDTTIISKEINIRLVGANAQATIKGSCFGHQRRIFKFKTLQDHQAPHSTSSVIIKSVLDDEALFSCYSLIAVAPEAQGTNAQQANKNMLLSNYARATSIPMLEVFANDVTCKHGAAISTFDEEQIFYLQSRGMTPMAAKKLLVTGFLE